MLQQAIKGCKLGQTVAYGHLWHIHMDVTYINYGDCLTFSHFSHSV